MEVRTMKPKGYIKKYLNDVGLDYEGLYRQLARDFYLMISYHREMSGFDYSKFKVCVKDIRNKFDAIAHRIDRLEEKHWKYFYATTIVPARNEMFGEYLEQKRKEHEHWRSGEWVFDYVMSRIYEILMEKLDIESNVVTLHFNFMGLSMPSTEDQIKARYKELALKYHPDRGGSTKDFQRLVEARDVCLAYVRKFNPTEVR